MSEPAAFDTDVDVEPLQDEFSGQEQGAASSGFDSGGEKRGGGLVLKAVIAVIILAAGGAGFFFMQNQGKPSLETASAPPVQARPAPLNPPPMQTARISPAASRAVVAETTPPLEPRISMMMPAPIKTTPAAAVPVTPVSSAPLPAAADDDPLSWKAPVSEVTSAVPMPETSLTMPAPSATIPEKQGATTEAAPEKADDKSNGRIIALEKRIDDLEKMITEFKGSVATKQDIESLKTIEKKPAADEKDVQPKKVKKTSVQRKRKSSPQKTETKWVLRAAKPGMAWISESASGELRTLSVGETISGVGKVISVMKDSDGKWVVKGAGGDIRQ